MRYALPVAVAAAVAAISGCLAGGTGGAPHGPPAAARAASAVSRLAWQPCSVQGTSLQCATLQVPLDYSHPDGRKITLALSRVPATAPAAQQQGALLVNPGGPGGPGRSLAATVAQGLNPAVRAEYDIIGFDTRG